jgi:hypothetical protein
MPHHGEKRHGTVRFAGLSNSLRSHGTAVGVPGLLRRKPATTDDFVQAIRYHID